jgi:hypothetical protein
VLLIAGFLWGIWRAGRAEGPLDDHPGGGVPVQAFFILPTRVHEQYCSQCSPSLLPLLAVVGLAGIAGGHRHRLVHQPHGIL